MSQLQVHLYRDSFSTPWGIRLQGGKDVGQALVIQRVFANSPAEGYLQRGDIILQLNNCEALELTHKRAQELFNSAGGQIRLTIKRVQYTKTEVPIKPKAPKSQAFRTVPLELTGPGVSINPSAIKKEFGVNYNRPPGHPSEVIMQRQSSKPWEDQEMLYKVHDTLAHKSYPYAPQVAPTTASGISCVNMYSGAPAHVPAPPAYVPGPPVEQPSDYIDPFPNYLPAQVEDDDEEYEFVPVKERRNKFSKSDFAPQARKPIQPKRPQPVFAHVPAPAPRAKPVTPTPVAAPAPFMPAEGEVVQPSVPAWTGTLTKVGGPKLWDAGYKPNPINKPGRPVSPTKKATPQGDFKPTQTQVLDFTGNDEDGTRVMHLQYNSPLEMYSRENVQETLQGQTNVAMGGGNTASQPKKTPAHERDWTQSALLRLINEEENCNVPPTAPIAPVMGEPRPTGKPPKKAAAPPAPAPPPPPPPPAASHGVMPVEMAVGVSDF